MSAYQGVLREHAQGHLQEHLGAFGAAHGIEGLSLDELGCCTLLLDDGLPMHLQYDDAREHLVLLAALGTVPAGTGARVYGSLLHANLFWAESQDATLALEAQTGEVVLQYAEPAARLDAHRLERLLGHFMDAARLWKQRLALLIEAALTGNGLDDGSPLPNMERGDA